MAVNAQAVAAYLNAQIEAGAQAVMIFDTWGGALADGVYQRFSLHYIQQVVSQLKREHDGNRVPVITFTKGGGLWLEEIAATGVDAVGLDWTVNLARARERVGGKVALQGNIDPSVLFAPPSTIRIEARAVLDSYGQSPRPRVQSWARHFAVHAAGTRRRTRRRSASSQPTIRASGNPGASGSSSGL